MELDAKLLEQLVCPQCKGKLDYEIEEEVLICGECKLAYPIRDGIPVMLVEEAVAVKEGK